MKTLLAAATIGLCALVCGCESKLSGPELAGLELCREWQIYTGYTVENGFQCHHIAEENRWVVSFDDEYSPEFELASFEYTKP